MGSILKFLGVIEGVAAAFIAIIIRSNGPSYGPAEDFNIMVSLSVGIGGVVGALILYALGHIYTRSDEIHEMLVNQKKAERPQEVMPETQGATA